MTIWALAADLIDPPPNPYRLDPAGWVRDKLDAHLWSKQVEIAEALRDHRKVAVKACHGAGKALALDTPLPTPTGWTTMGAVAVGDRLYDEQGHPCTVVGLSEVFHRTCYRVTFDDGSSIVAAGDHLWQTIDLPTRHRVRVGRANRNEKPITDWRDHWSLSETNTMADMAAKPTVGGQRRWAIPCARPIDGNRVALPVPPYTLGAWLGDGTTVCAAITVHHDDAPHTLDQIRAEGVTVRERPSAHRETTGCYGLNNGVRAGLRSLGVLGAKAVPDVVLRADTATRLAVLQGLMDTDGFACRGGEVGIDLTCEPLADGVAELVRSLGWKARRGQKRAMLNGVDHGPVYRLSYRPDVPVFRLPRKIAASVPSQAQASRRTIRTVVSIDQVDTVPTRCVEVSSPSHLYLAGEAFIPTHNSWVAGAIVSQWIDTHPPGEARAVTSAPTDAQVKAILWNEIMRNHRKGGLPGYITLEAQWKLAGELVAFGRKPADHDEHGFQGIHARYLLVVLDEACGIPPALWTAAGTLGTNKDSRMLAIGNPDDPSSEFAAICAGAPEDGTSGLSDEGWWVITISIFDTPNFTDEPVPAALRDMLPSQTWLDDHTHKWGVGSPLYTSKVLGRFPADASTGAVPWSWIKACQGEEATARVGGLRVPVELGVDVAGSDAGDETVVYERQGMRAGRRWAVQSSDPEIVLQLIEDAVRESGATRLKIDAIGVGWGLIAPLRRTFPDLDVVPVVVSEAAPGVDPEDGKPMADKFANLRAYLWWQVGRVYSQEHRWDLTDVPDETLNELAAPKYREKKGKILIESKDDLRKRIGRSTDNADGLLLAFYDPPVETGPVRSFAYPDSLTE